MVSLFSWDEGPTRSALVCRLTRKYLLPEDVPVTILGISRAKKLPIRTIQTTDVSKTFKRRKAAETAARVTAGRKTPGVAYVCSDDEGRGNDDVYLVCF